MTDEERERAEYIDRIAAPTVRTAVRLVASVLNRDTRQMHALADETLHGDLTREVIIALAQMFAAVLESDAEVAGESPDAFLAWLLDVDLRAIG